MTLALGLDDASAIRSIILLRVPCAAGPTPLASASKRPARSLLACRFALAPSNAARCVTSRPRGRHLVPLEVCEGARRHRLTRSEKAGLGPRLPDDAVSADGNNPNRDRIAVGPLQRPAFAVGCGRQHPREEHAVLRARHGPALPGTRNIGELDSAALREGGILNGRQGAARISDGGEAEDAFHEKLPEKEKDTPFAGPWGRYSWSATFMGTVLNVEPFPSPR